MFVHCCAALKWNNSYFEQSAENAWQCGSKTKQIKREKVSKFFWQEMACKVLSLNFI